MKKKDLSILEKNISYKFKNKNLLKNALYHRSYVNESFDKNITSNERLEFLGDAVLNLIIGQILMELYPCMNEGELSITRANLVNEFSLASIANSIDIGSFVFLGKGEIQTKGSKKPSILADTFEAIISAIYIDAGFEKVFSVITYHFNSSIKSVGIAESGRDYKSKLQELIQTTHKITPVYSVIDEQGPDHNKTFCVKMSVCSINTKGVGKTKKIAEQDAAKKAIKLLDNSKIK